MPIAFMYGICPFILLLFMVDGGENQIAYMDPTGYIQQLALYFHHPGTFKHFTKLNFAILHFFGRIALS